MRTRQYNPGLPDKVHGADDWKKIIATRLLERYDSWRRSGLSHDEALQRTLDSSTAGPGSLSLFRSMLKRNPKADKETGLHVEFSPVNNAYFVMWHNAVLNVVNTKAEAREIVKDLTRKQNPGATNLAQYVQAAMDHSRGAHDAGGKVLHETPKAKRREFAREIWWRRGYRNPRGRAEGELEVLDKDPHTEVDYEPRSKHLPEKCGNCAHFIAANPPRCQTVKSPINSAAWCERYDSRGQRQNPAAKVMREWRSGTLRTSSGKLVPRGSAGELQARAILLSELRREGRIGPRQNPSGSADELYRKFHGVQPDNHLVFDVPLIDPYGSHPEIAQFGLLVRMVIGEGIEVKGSENDDEFTVTPVADEWWHAEPCFVPSLHEYKRMVEKVRTQTDVDQVKSWLRRNGTPDLAGAPPEGHQIYIIGGNQDLTPWLGRMGADDSKEFIDLGFCYMVEYFTQKRFDHMKPVDYFHAFGEKSGVQPRLIYWRKIPMLQLVGGEYIVKPAGITN